MVGIQAATNDSDSIITSYRDHCTHIAKGGTLLEVIAECMGRVDGASKGNGGSMHMYNKVTSPTAPPSTAPPCLELLSHCSPLRGA